MTTDAKYLADAIARQFVMDGRDYWHDGATFVVTLRNEGGHLLVCASSCEEPREAIVHHDPRHPHGAAAPALPEPGPGPKLVSVTHQDAPPREKPRAANTTGAAPDIGSSLRLLGGKPEAETDP